MQNKEVLKIKPIILSKLIKLIQRPLLEYIQILLEIIITFKKTNQKDLRFHSLIQHAEQFQLNLKQIKKLTLRCSNINDANIIYNELINFLNHFDSLNNEIFAMFQPLIMKFDHYHKFFQSFKVLNDINDKIGEDGHCDITLKREIEWFIKYHNDLLSRLKLESQNSHGNQYPVKFQSRDSLYKKSIN